MFLRVLCGFIYRNFLFLQANRDGQTPADRGTHVEPQGRERLWGLFPLQQSAGTRPLSNGIDYSASAGSSRRAHCVDYPSSEKPVALDPS